MNRFSSNRAPERKITQDDLVIPRKMYIDDLKSAKELRGKTVWMQAGYQQQSNAKGSSPGPP
jgi:hypothetical protein